LPPTEPIQAQWSPSSGSGGSHPFDDEADQRKEVGSSEDACKRAQEAPAHCISQAFAQGSAQKTPRHQNIRLSMLGFNTFGKFTISLSVPALFHPEHHQ